MRYPFTASARSISILFNGRMHNIPNTHPFFEKLAEALKETNHDAEKIRALVDQPSVLADLTEGDVTVIGNSLYYRGEVLHSSLSTKVMNLIGAGYDAVPWAKFLNRMMTNSSENSRKALFDFLATFDAPITDDGCFVAFKRVRSDYMDKYTGTYDNSPGKIVEMPREEVNDDPAQACSSGLHACSIAYLDHAYVRGSDMRTVAVKIAPEDVVSVPKDYQFAKLRCCRYEVLGDIDEASLTPDEVVNRRMVSEDIFATGGTVEGPGYYAVVGNYPAGISGPSDNIFTDGDDDADDPEYGDWEGMCVWCDHDPCDCDDDCDECGNDIDACFCDEFPEEEPDQDGGSIAFVSIRSHGGMDLRDVVKLKPEPPFDPDTHVMLGDGVISKAEFLETMAMSNGVADLADFYDCSEATIFSTMQAAVKA